MSYVIVRLTVEDFAKWKSVFDELSTLRKNSGSKGGQLFRKADNPNEVVIIFEWPDLDKGRQYFQSDALRQAMQRAGVIGRPDVTYLDLAGQPSA
jgi:heme-degrading monooxygenase HmoA